jgi:5-enolpyruvylshikimate-3-phosphate synthase
MRQTSGIQNHSTGADCHSTVGCVSALGIEVQGEGTTVNHPHNVEPFGRAFDNASV